MLRFNYKGYIGDAEYDEDCDCFYGEIINLQDVIAFQGNCVKNLRQEFIDSVEDYLDFCKERGEKPEKSYA